MFNKRLHPVSYQWFIMIPVSLSDCIFTMYLLSIHQSLCDRNSLGNVRSTRDLQLDVL